MPSGASVGSHEACELRDGDNNRFHGLGVLGAISSVNEVIAPDLIGLSISDQVNIDTRLIALDGTKNKSHLGANATLAVSIAVAKAAALSAEIPLYQYLADKNPTILPVPLLNILNGGKHALGSSDFQEFMIAPNGAESFQQALQMAVEVYQTLRQILIEQNLTTVGDEGGFFLPDSKTEDSLGLLIQAIEEAGYQPGVDIDLALDCAATELYSSGKYNLKTDKLKLDSTQMIHLFDHLINKYPIFSIEDPLAEDDWLGFAKMTEELGESLQIVGDDLFCTNQNRLQQGIDQKCANAIIIKPNQIGTLTETIETIRLAQKHGYAAIISHRSGDTEDPFIADLAVATGCGQIKTGAPCRGERTAKYNQLLRIEEDLGKKAKYLGIK